MSDDVTPVKARKPSNANVMPEHAESVVSTASLEDSVRALVALVKDHRRPGDVDVDTALAAVESALAA